MPCLFYQFLDHKVLKAHQEETEKMEAKVHRDLKEK
jgi:hypothetical protein